LYLLANFEKKYKILSLKRFIVYYLFYTALLAGISILLPVLFPSNKLLCNQFWAIFSFVAVITCIAYILVHLGIKYQPEAGVMAIMASIAFKMLFCLTFILVYDFKAKGIGLTFAFNFFSLYLLFSFFEIYSLLLNLRHQNK
jgi:hypothetical protein